LWFALDRKVELLKKANKGKELIEEGERCLGINGNLLG
jgi:hypothetical protein